MRRMKSVNLLILMFVLGACAAPPGAAQPLVTVSSAVVATATLLPTSPPTATPPPTVTPVPVTPSPTPCAGLRGSTKDVVLDAPLLRFPLRVHIYTPPCFDPSGETRYPALYLLHGQSYTNLHWDDLGADEAADDLITSGQASPFLIIMPQEAQDLIDAGSSPYGQALIETLVPWVDATYPTCADASCRAIGGISRGAGWAVHVALRNADVFGAVGAHSLAAFYGEAFRLPTTLAAIPEGSVPRFYVDSGEHDRYLYSAVEFETALDQSGVAHDWYLFQGLHDDDYWAAHMEFYIRWYADFFDGR